MFNKILIANRGEIAVRVVRACRDLGVISLVVFSEADRDALHTQIADEAVCIGPARSGESYLNEQNILAAAVAAGAEAIHPGFGFLAENAGFARKCRELGITFIGPTPETMELMGDKVAARRLVQSAGVPVIPGSDGAIEDAAEARAISRETGFPLMLKAAAGGGGRGIRRVERAEELDRAFDTASNEAKAAFGDGRLYVEKCIIGPRHIEFQILADSYGNLIHLYERDCSVQRRHQKLIEETPSSFLTPELRTEMGNAALRAAKAAGYVNAGTIEFLVDKDRRFYFMEMNTRIQVEHPVTEIACGIDLVCAQITIAAGEKLSLRQEDIKPWGHVMECRINAEDPARSFAPCPGTVHGMHVPGGPGVRVDSAVYQGYTIPPFYDSMIAKLIVSGNGRDETIRRMRRALAEFLVDGVTTNVDFQMEILKNPDFVSGNYTTEFLEKLSP